MSRIARRPAVGVRVTKTHGSASGSEVCSISSSQGDEIAPRIINKESHKNFVKSVFSIRGIVTVGGHGKRGED